MERPKYATLRVLHAPHAVRDALPLVGFSAQEPAPRLQLGVTERYTRSSPASDYTVTHVFEWSVTREPVVQDEEDMLAMMQLDVPGPSELASGHLNLGTTLYADPAAPFVYDLEIINDPAVSATERAAPYGAAAVLARALRAVQGGLFTDAPVGEHVDILYQQIVAPYALELAYEYNSFYNDNPALHTAQNSPLSYVWAAAWNNYGTDRATVTVAATHTMRDAGAGRSIHAFDVAVFNSDPLAPHSVLRSMSYAFALEDLQNAAATGAAIHAIDGEAAALMTRNRRRFRGRSAAHRYALARPPAFSGDDERDWARLEAAVIAPMLWTAFIYLKERAGDADTDDTDRTLADATDAYATQHDTTVLAPAATRPFGTEPAALPAAARLASPLVLYEEVVGAALPAPQVAAWSAEARRNAPPAAADAIFELAAVEVRFAGVPRRNETGDLEYRPYGRHRRLVSVSAVVRIKVPDAFLALPPNQVIFELFAPPVADKWARDAGVASDTQLQSPQEGAVLLRVTKAALRVNALYDAATLGPLTTASPTTHFVVSFVIPIERFGTPAEREESDATQLTQYLAATASLAEVFWLDALLARVAHTERVALAAREMRTFEYATTMPRADSPYPLTDGPRHTLLVPYYAALVTQGTGAPWTQSLTPEPKGPARKKKRNDADEDDEDGGSALIVDKARGLLKGAAPVGIHGHAHEVLVAPLLRSWAMRWYRATDKTQSQAAQEAGGRARARDASKPDSYYYHAATHMADGSSVPFDDQRLESELNAQLSELLFGPARQRSLDFRFLDRRGAFVPCRVSDDYAHYFPAPVGYDDYFDIVSDL